VQVATEHWKESGKEVPADYEQKLMSMATFCSRHDVATVPDPYYGGPSGFEMVLDLLDDACTGLLKHIESK
jgi:protein-tyrosine phosphatase